MNDYEIDALTSDRVNLNNYDIIDILSIIDGDEIKEDLSDGA